VRGNKVGVAVLVKVVLYVGLNKKKKGWVEIIKQVC